MRMNAMQEADREPVRHWNAPEHVATCETCKQRKAWLASGAAEYRREDLDSQDVADLLAHAARMAQDKRFHGPWTWTASTREWGHGIVVEWRADDYSPNGEGTLDVLIQRPDAAFLVCDVRRSNAAPPVKRRKTARTP